MQEPPKSAYLELRTGESYATEAGPPTVWTVDRLVPQGGLTLVSAPPKAGKSTFALSLALAVVRGGSVLGRDCTPCNVLYCALEERRSQIEAKMHAFGWGDSWKKLVIHTGPLKAPPLAPEEPLPDLWADLLDQVAHWNFRLVIIDTLGRWWADEVFDINDYQEVGKLMAQARVVAQTMECAIMFIHHTRKSRDGGEIDAPLGSVNITAQVDTTIVIRRGETDEGDEYRYADSEQREGDPIHKAVLRLDPHTRLLVPTDNGGSPMTSAQFEESRHRGALRRALRGMSGLTEREIAVRVPAVPPKVLGGALRRMVRDNLVARTGNGSKGKPYRYTLIKGAKKRETRKPLDN